MAFAMLIVGALALVAGVVVLWGPGAGLLATGILMVLAGIDMSRDGPVTGVTP